LSDTSSIPAFYMDIGDRVNAQIPRHAVADQRHTVVNLTVCGYMGMGFFRRAGLMRHPALTFLTALAALALASCGGENTAPAPEPEADAPRPIAAPELSEGADAATVTGSENAPAALEAARTPFVIVMMGDSLTGGHEIPEGTALPYQLGPLLVQSGADVELRNAGVPGDSTALGLARFEADVLSVTGDLAAADGVIIEFGAVDMLSGVPVADIRANLTAMIEAAQARDLWVGLVGMRAPLEIGRASCRERV